MVTKSDYEQIKLEYERVEAKEKAERMAKEKAERSKTANEKFLVDQKVMDNILLAGIEDRKKDIVDALGDKSTNVDVLLDLISLLILKSDNKNNIKIKQYIDSLGRKYNK
jgi:hypothetical protein